LSAGSSERLIKGFIIVGLARIGEIDSRRQVSTLAGLIGFHKSILPICEIISDLCALCASVVKIKYS